MKNLAAYIFCCLVFCLPASARATDTLTVEQVRQLAVQNSPLQQKKLLAESVAALQIRNLRSNDLPRISVGAQATWQSDVFGLPIESPFFQIPEVPKDQYKLTVDVSQRLWDGHSDRFVRQQRELESQLAAAQTDVDVFQVREVVTDLFFKILLLQESEKVLAAARADLDNRFRQAQAAVTGGVTLRSTADQLQIQLWKTDQQLESARADRMALLQILARWIGRDDSNFALQRPVGIISNFQFQVSKSARPEYKLFELQQQNLQLRQKTLHLSAQPRLDAFVQGGLGRPNPFNFFETGFEPFALLGLRAVWTPLDWGNRSRDAQVFDLQSQTITTQRLAFDQRFEASTVKDLSDVAKNQALLHQDDAIITLQEDIVRRAEAQVQNGVMTSTDYLAQLNLLTQARLTRTTHEIQALQAREMLRAKVDQE